MTFADISKAVKSSNILISGGNIKTSGEEYLIRSNNKNYYANELNEIVIKNNNEGEEQQIINTISQDNIVSLGEQSTLLSILPEGDEKSQYEYAINLLKQGDYETAEKAFTEFISIGDDKNCLLYTSPSPRD